MQVRTATVSLDASSQRVFDYLAEPRNHAEWATEFIRHMEETECQLRADTQMGRVRYGVESDAHTGVIDILITPDDGPTVRFPTRVVDVGAGSGAFAFTLAQLPEMSDDEFERTFASLGRELANLRRRLSR